MLSLLHIYRVLSEELLAMFKQCPSLIMEERLEIMDYISALRHITGCEDFFLHVVSADILSLLIKPTAATSNLLTDF